jgi:RNA polymerase sigma-70 factor (ECF subfamily)
MPLSNRHVDDSVVPPQEHDLVDRVRAGDATAFESLFHLYFAAMLRFAMSFVAETDVAEDIVQEVFGRIWVQRAAWYPPADVLSYLLAAVRNRALDIVTTEQRRTVTMQRYFGPHAAPTLRPGMAADQHLESVQQQTMLWGVIQTLPEHQRTVLLLRWRYGLEWREIAPIMGISEVAARKSHSRALQTLRKRLPEDFE